MNLRSVKVKIIVHIISRSGNSKPNNNINTVIIDISEQLLDICVVKLLIFTYHLNCLLLSWQL